MPRMGKTKRLPQTLRHSLLAKLKKIETDSVKLGFLKTVQPNSFSKLTPAACNFKNNAQETYLFVSDP